jgi:hypothetical protein
VLQIAHERAAVAGHEHGVVAADLDAAVAVARVLGELARGVVLDQLAREPVRHAHALAVDLGPGIAPQLQRLRVVAEIDADLLEHRVRVGLDRAERFLREGLVTGHPAGHVRCLARGSGAAARRLPGGATAATPASSFAHVLVLPLRQCNNGATKRQRRAPPGQAPAPTSARVWPALAQQR